MFDYILNNLLLCVQRITRTLVNIPVIYIPKEKRKVDLELAKLF